MEGTDIQDADWKYLVSNASNEKGQWVVGKNDGCVEMDMSNDGGLVNGQIYIFGHE